MNINNKDGINMLTNYWYNIANNLKKINSPKYVFVGDIHGDLNQILLPLVETNLIIIKNDIEKVYESEISSNLDVYIPKFDLNKNIKTEIYFLGDYVDEGNFSRNVLFILKEISKLDNVHLVIGNHDANIFGNYILFKENKLDFTTLKSSWNTLQKEFSPYEEFTFSKNKIIHKKFSTDDILKDYFKPVFDIFYQLMKENKLNVCYNVENFLISHTTITKKSVEELNKQKERIKKLTNKQIFQKKLDFSNDDLNINEKFKFSSDSFIASNKILYNRLNTNLISENNIVGHTPGGDLRILNINPIFSETNEERKLHTNPQIVEGKKIYYFDVKASSGFDIDNISRPDYFFTDDFKKFDFSESKAIRLFYNVEKNLLELQEYQGKFKFNGVKVI